MLWAVVFAMMGYPPFVASDVTVGTCGGSPTFTHSGGGECRFAGEYGADLPRNLRRAGGGYQAANATRASGCRFLLAVIVPPPSLAEPGPVRDYNRSLLVAGNVMGILDQNASGMMNNVVTRNR